MGPFMSHKFTLTVIVMFLLGLMTAVTGLDHDRLFLFIPGLIAILLSAAVVVLRTRGVGYSPYIMASIIVGCALSIFSLCFDNTSLISSLLVAPSFVATSAVIFSFICIFGASFERILSAVFVFMINCAVSSFAMVFTYAIDGRTIADYIGLGHITTIEANQLIMQQAVVTMVVCIICLCLAHRYFKKMGVNRFDRDLMLRGA